MAGGATIRRRAWSAVRAFAAAWSRDNASLLAAGVAFYAIFSLAPLIALALLVSSLWFGDAARSELVMAAGQYVSGPTADALARLAKTADRHRTSGTTLVTIALLAFGASAVFGALRNALDLILEVPRRRSGGWLRFFAARLFSVVMVAGLLAFLVATVAVTSTLAVVAHVLPHLPPGAIAAGRGIEIAVSTALVALLFAVILRFVPDLHPPWQHILRGALPAAVLFSLGRFALGVYLAHSGVARSYGAAASVVVILVAVYFAVLALFAAAEITQLSVRRHPAFTSTRRKRQAAARRRAKK